MTPKPPKQPLAPKRPSAKPATPLAAPPSDTLETLAQTRLAFGADADWRSTWAALPGKTGRARFEAWVEQQLHPHDVKDYTCERKLAALKLATLTKSTTQLWQDHIVAAQKNEGMKGELKHQPLHEVETATWVRAIYSRRQLFEVLVDAWHTHFSVNGKDGQAPAVFPQYDQDVIRAHALGNFRELLEAVAKSPAMLLYLNNDVNQSGNPNENYARELFELHTLGAEHYLGTMPRTEAPGYAAGRPAGYVDGDVYEAARCFTGWRLDAGNKSDDTGVFQYFEPWHDRFQKIVLGKGIIEHQPPMKDGQDVLDLLSAHPGTARHVARRLAVRLVADEPSSALIEAAAKEFRAKAKAPDQLRHVVRAIVLSEEFAATSREKLRRPFELVAAALRGLGAEVTPSEDFLRETGRLGQRLFEWRTPDGYPDQRIRWASTGLMVERWRFCNQLAAGKLAGVDFDAAAATPAALASPRDLANHWLSRLLPRAPSARTVGAMQAFLAQGRNPLQPLPPKAREARLGPAVALAMMSPEMQWR